MSNLLICKHKREYIYGHAWHRNPYWGQMNPTIQNSNQIHIGKLSLRSENICSNGLFYYHYLTIKYWHLLVKLLDVTRCNALKRDQKVSFWQIYLANVQLTRCNHCHSQAVLFECWMLGERGIPYTPIQCLWNNPLPRNPTPPTSNTQILEVILPVLPLADLLFTQRVTGMKQLMKVILPP